MATHAGVALELGITRPSGSGMKMMSPQMEAILIWCQCRTREYEVRFFFCYNLNRKLARALGSISQKEGVPRSSIHIPQREEKRCDAFVLLRNSTFPPR